MDYGYVVYMFSVFVFGCGFIILWCCFFDVVFVYVIYILVVFVVWVRRGFLLNWRLILICNIKGKIKGVRDRFDDIEVIVFVVGICGGDIVI